MPILDPFGTRKKLWSFPQLFHNYLIIKYVLLKNPLILLLIPKTLQWLPDFTECHFCSVVLSIVLTFKEL